MVVFFYPMVAVALLLSLGEANEGEVKKWPVNEPPKLLKPLGSESASNFRQVTISYADASKTANAGLAKPLGIGEHRQATAKRNPYQGIKFGETQRLAGTIKTEHKNDLGKFVPVGDKPAALLKLQLPNTKPVEPTGVFVDSQKRVHYKPSVTALNAPNYSQTYKPLASANNHQAPMPAQKHFVDLTEKENLKGNNASLHKLDAFNRRISNWGGHVIEDENEAAAKQSRQMQKPKTPNVTRLFGVSNPEVAEMKEAWPKLRKVGTNIPELKAFEDKAGNE